MIINALKTFGSSLDESNETAEFAKSIPASTTGNYTLDLCGCIVDYKATSKLLDAILCHIRDRGSPAKIEVIYDINFQLRLFIKWLFFGSVELGLNEGTYSDEEITQRVDVGLRNKQIALLVRAINDKGEDIQRHQYGF